MKLKTKQKLFLGPFWTIISKMEIKIDSNHPMESILFLVIQAPICINIFEYL